MPTQSAGHVVRIEVRRNYPQVLNGLALVYELPKGELMPILETFPLALNLTLARRQTAIDPLPGLNWMPWCPRFGCAPGFR